MIDHYVPEIEQKRRYSRLDPNNMFILQNWELSSHLFKNLHILVAKYFYKAIKRQKLLRSKNLLLVFLSNLSNEKLGMPNNAQDTFVGNI